jgi:putative membrane protein
MYRAWFIMWRLFYWVLLVGLVAWVVGKLTGRKKKEAVTPASRDPLDIVKERYARGEISEEQFERMKKDLR